MRILNVGDFNWMTGRERDTANVDLFAIRTKLGAAAIRARHQVVEFSDRAVARTATPFRSRRAGRGAANRTFLRVVDEVRPDLVLLHFADDLDNATLAEARRLARGLTIVDINIDPLPDPKNQARLQHRRAAVDAVFVTTAGEALKTLAAPPAGFAAYMPNPVDPAVETGRAFETVEPEVDLIFPAGDDSPRQVGAERRRPSELVADLRGRAPGLRLAAPGLETPRLRGARYLDALSRARMGWALSRVNDQPLYASDRMAHMLGSGLLTFIDAKAGFDRFYAAGEVCFYPDFEALAAALMRFGQDDGLARETARRGWTRTWRLFETDRVFGYLIDQLYRDGGAADYEWPVERWSA